MTQARQRLKGESGSYTKFSVSSFGVAALLLVSTFTVILMSWSSSRTVSYSLNGEWMSPLGKNMTASCRSETKWKCICYLESEQLHFEGVINASPLHSSGWFAVVAPTSHRKAFLYHHSGKLRVLVSSEEGQYSSIEYNRVANRVGDLQSLVKLKGKYLATLLVMVGTSRWLQCRFFGSGARHKRMFSAGSST